MNLKEETENKLILDKDKKTKEIEEIFTELYKEKKRVRGKKNKKINKIEEPKDIECGKKILGRKRKDDTTVGERTRYSSYNIIKKIKNKIINNILGFLCSIFLITSIGSRKDFISDKCNSFKI